MHVSGVRDTLAYQSGTDETEQVFDLSHVCSAGWCHQCISVAPLGWVLGWVLGWALGWVLGWSSRVWCRVVLGEGGRCGSLSCWCCSGPQVVALWRVVGADVGWAGSLR